MRTAKTLIRLGGCPGSDWVDAQADLSLHWAHTHFVGLVMSWLKILTIHMLITGNSIYLFIFNNIIYSFFHKTLS